MSNPATKWAFNQRIPSGQQLVLLHLANHHNRNTGRCDPSVQLLAAETQITDRAVRRHLRDLEEWGLVSTSRSNGRSSNKYRLHFDVVRKGGVLSPYRSDQEPETDNEATDLSGLGAPDFSGSAQPQPGHERHSTRTPCPPTRTPCPPNIGKNLEGTEEEKVSPQIRSTWDMTVAVERPDAAQLGKTSVPRKPAAKPKASDPVIVEAVEAWNDMAGRKDLPRCQIISAARCSAIAARLKEAGGIDGWIAMIELVAASAFLTGGNDRGWRGANIDFVSTASKFHKIMEGVYNDRGSTNGQKRSPANDTMRDQLERALEINRRKRANGEL